MAYSLTGITITQTGTDNDLSGLSAIAGVTVSTVGEKTHYGLGTLQLSIDGDLTFNGREETISSDYIPTVSQDYVFKVNDGASLTINCYEEIDGERIYYQDVVLTSTNVSHFCCGQAGWSIEKRGYLEMNGGTLQIGSAIYAETGAAKYIQAQILAQPGSVGALIRQLRPYFYIDGLLVSHVELVLDRQPLAFPSQLLRGLHMFGNSVATQGGKGEELTFESPIFTGQVAEQIRISDWGFYKVLNSSTGSNLKIKGGIGNSRSSGLYRNYRQVKFNFEDADGNPIEYITVHSKDTDHGERRNWIASGLGSDTTDINFVDDRYYEFLSGSTGSTPTEEIMLAVLARPAGSESDAPNTGLNTIDIRGNTNVLGEDIFTFHFLNYNYTKNSTSQKLAGEGELEVNFVVFNDNSLTETDQTVVNAYTSIDNAPEFYDYAKSYLVDNFPTLLGDGITEKLVAREGNTINLGTRNLTIDASATDVLAVDGATGDLTIKSLIFTGNLKTSGTVTFLNGATINGAIADVNGDSSISVTVPAGYDNTIELYATKTDAENQTNLIATGPKFTYFVATYGGQTLWYRLEQTDGSYIIENYLVPNLAGFYTVNLVVTGENAALASIKAVTDRLDTMIEVSGGNQVFNAEALGSLKPDLTTINDNVKKSSLLIPANEDLS